MGRRKLIEVYEEITATCNWVVPAGCKSVDAFVVGGGGNGTSDSKGGNGGECKTYTGIPVTPGEVIWILAGRAGTYSCFKNASYQARGAQGVTGGEAGVMIGKGNPGKDGVYAFNDPIRFPKPFGASGGGGAANTLAAATSYDGGKGGNYGGGNGGWASYQSGSDGVNATWYGAGGGGGANAYNGRCNSGSGYQGIVILHYWRYK